MWNTAGLEELYRPWREVADRGVQIHIGEFGCYNKTPQDIALRWLEDIIDLYRQWGWGYSLWELEGSCVHRCIRPHYFMSDIEKPVSQKRYHEDR